MTIYFILSNYFNNGIYGFYSSIKRARIAFEDFLRNNDYIVTAKKVMNAKKLDGYFYRFTTNSGETFEAELCSGYMDFEFVVGFCKEE